MLDASAFIQGYNLDAGEEQFTVPEVHAEVSDEIARLRYEGAVASGRLAEISPGKESIKRIETEVRRLGETKLSPTDRQLLALALQLREEGLDPVVVSDDYSVQNTASKLGLGFRSRGARGISKRLSWVTYCPGCRRTYELEQEGNVCPICGTELKRKPRRGERS